jgi:multiple sugar transport system substrate-binding protein
MEETMKKKGICFLIGLCLFGFISCAKKAPENVSLEIWGSSQTMEMFYNEVVTPAFKKAYPEVENVNILYMPIQEYVKKIAVALPSGDVPDLMEIEDSWATPFVTAEYFEPNTRELDEILNQMRPELRNLVTYKGKAYGVPISPFHELMFYNLDMLEAAAITKIPDTIDEIIDAAVKMTRRDAGGKIEVSGFSMRLGGNPAGTSQKFWVLALLGNDVDIWEESKTQPGKYHCGFDNEGGYNALKLYIDMLYKYKIDDFASMKDTEAFAKERTAINMREASSSYSIITQGPNVNWITAPMPRGAKQRATFLICLNFYVPKDGKNKEYARKYIEVATSRDMYSIQSQRRAGFNPYVDMDPTEGLDERLRPSFVFGPDMKVYTVPVHNAYDMAQVKIGEALPTILQKSELLDNPEGIKREVAELARLVNDAYKEFDEYAE